MNEELSLLAIIVGIAHSRIRLATLLISEDLDEVRNIYDIIKVIFYC